MAKEQIDDQERGLTEPVQLEHTKAFSPMSRRVFIKASTGTAAALMLSNLIACRARPDLLSSELPQPEVLKPDKDGILSLTYNLAFADYIIKRNNDDGEQIASKNLRNRTYELKRGNDFQPMIPGPTLRVNGGDQIKLELINSLPKNNHDHDIGCGANGENLPNCFHDLETTNFHTHGLHISPTKPSDDVLIRITPKDDPVCDPDDDDCFQGQFNFTFDIWENHPPGTHWYHPHKHGSTNQQVQNGLAGLLIINDYPETVPPELAAAEDLVFVLQELQKDPNPPANAGPMTLSATDDAFYFTVNGVEKPIIRLKQGELQRWRFVNAGVSDNGYVNLALVSEKQASGSEIACNDPGGAACQTMTLIAMDGIYLDQMQEVTNLLLAPGNRADFLVKLTQPGTYWLRDLGHNRGDGLVTALAEGVEAPLRGRIRAIVIVEESDIDMPLPTKLPDPSPQDPAFLRPFDDDEITGYRQVVFDMTCKKGLMLNCQKFDPGRIDHLVRLNAAEEWMLINRSHFDHPFHIHVNPFLVIEKNGRPIDNPRWQDVVNISGVDNARKETGDPNLEYGSIKIRTRYPNFVGKYVLHCHILAHEDFGMMQLVEVRDDVEYKGESPLASATPLDNPVCQIGEDDKQMPPDFNCNDS